MCISAAISTPFHRPNEMKSIQLHDSIDGLSQKIVSITLHYITHYIMGVFMSKPNPFEEASRDLVTLNNQVCASADAAISVHNVEII